MRRTSRIRTDFGTDKLEERQRLSASYAAPYGGGGYGGGYGGGGYGGSGYGGGGYGSYNGSGSSNLGFGG